MKGQKVYTVTEESAVEGMHDIDVHVFAEREDAVKRWKFVVVLWKDGFGEWMHTTEKEGEFEAWQDGYYDENHVTVYLDNVGELPSNLHLILSGWRGDKDVNPHKLPVSSPIWKDGAKSCMCTENVINCPGDCTACATVKGGCWGAKKGDTILFEAH